MDSVITLYTKEHARDLQFQVIIISVVVVMFFTYYFPTTYAFVVILLAMTWFVANSYVNIRKDTVLDMNQSTMHKLRTLQSISEKYVKTKITHFNAGAQSKVPSYIRKGIYERTRLDYLYMDSNLVIFLYSIKDLATFDNKGFYTLIKITNSILKIKSDVEQYVKSTGSPPSNIASLLEDCLELRKSGVNTLHNFIFSAPPQRHMRKYINDSIERYHVLITRPVDDVHRIYVNHIKTSPINTMTRFISYNTTKPYDAIDNHSLVPSKTPDKVISYYY